ncbi:PREDICTED: cysteine proteinase inhibitor 1-like [Ipomoea nil]|uniref:cysteine proteinase inhibitor 1-like n=1 Tax=Ipomoea nil TaxID=35883 RepID=UPI0009015947|nr:PREDICTED: cysteine proteinase inhibitor 1-like [Ipomoea nil]
MNCRSISPNHQKMALNSRSVSLTLFSLAVATALFSNAVAALGGQKGPLIGGWSSIKDPKAPYVVEFAKFAIDAHNKEAKTNLKFKSVIEGQSQVVAGMNYKLVIAAEDGSAGNKYEAVVYDRPWDKFRELTSFKQL